MSSRSLIIFLALIALALSACSRMTGATAPPATLTSPSLPVVAASPSPAANPAFDVTPARLITGLITERGIAMPSPEGLKALFPERS